MLFITSSCIDQEEGKYIPGVNGPKLNIQNGKILLSIELENVDIPGGVTLPLKDLPNSTVSVGPSLDDSGIFTGTLIQVSFDPKDAENDDFNVVPPQVLPDGRPFPFTVDGSLPALAFQVSKAKNTTFYVSNKLFGFFLPISLPRDFTMDVHYRLKVNGKNYGIVSLIHPNEYDEGSGVIVLLTLETIKKDRAAQKLLKWSKRNKSRLF